MSRTTWTWNKDIRVPNAAWPCQSDLRTWRCPWERWGGQIRSRPGSNSTPLSSSCYLDNPAKKRRARLFHKFSIQTFQQSNLSCHVFFFFLEKINHLSWQSRKASQRHPQLFLCPPVGMTTVGKEDGVVHGSQQKIWICRSLFTTPSRLCDLSNWNFLLSNCRNGAHPGLLQSNFQKIQKEDTCKQSLPPKGP